MAAKKTAKKNKGDLEDHSRLKEAVHQLFGEDEETEEEEEEAEEEEEEA
jgi:hypothetical protein